MREPRSEKPEATPSAARFAAFGAFLSGGLLLAVAALRQQLDPWLTGAALLALPLSVLAVTLRKEGRSGAVPLKTQVAPPGNVADALLANIPDPIVLVDERAVVLEANGAARRLLGGVAIGRPLSFAVRSPDVLDGVASVLATGEPVKVAYAERVPVERAFEVLIGPLAAEAKGAQAHGGVILFFRDVTSAQRLERMRVDFVANASHELRTPLASLLGFIETLQGPARNDAAARERFLAIMREQARRMARLVEDLLSLSRIEMRAHVAPEGVVDLAFLVREMIDTLAPLARERGLAIEAELPDRPVWVEGDRDELLRMAENLIENAVKYGEGGGRVDVTLAASQGPGETAGWTELLVRDYGPGIAPEHLPRLTERFYRVDVAQSREKGGTGLGLAIVKHIVNRHRGRLAIESEPGRGAAFRVTLPEAPPRAGAAP